jgi:tetratricopeptide (TPR) repeat protein
VHEAVAKALVEIHAGKLDEHAALIAHHFAAAGNATEAVRWHARAAAWIEGRDLHAERHHWMQLLELLGDEPETAELAHTGLRACNRLMDLATFLGLDLARAEALYHRGRALALPLDEPALEAGLIAFFARLAMFAGQLELARGAVEEALGLAPRVDDPDRYAELIQAATITVSHVGGYPDALEVVKAALASGKVTSTSPVALARLTAMHGNSLTHLGRLAAARSQLDRAAELVSDSPAQGLALLIELFSAIELAESGFPEGSLERIAVLVARADETETHNIRSNARFRLAQAHLLAGRPDAALEAVEAGLGISSETGVNPGPGSLFTAVSAQALLAQGEVARARELIERVAASPPATAVGKHAYLVALAQVLVASDVRGERVRIESSLTQAAVQAEYVGSPGLQAVVCTERGHLARTLGDEAGWERELREALRIYTEMDATGWMERINEKLAP